MAESTGRAERRNIVLIAGGTWHDFDHARLELLTRLGCHEVARTRVFEDYACIDALRDADALVTYTCEVSPSPAEQAALVEFVHRGGRWLALHGTNAATDNPATDGAFPPDAFGAVEPLLGSRFLAHPPIGSFMVETADEDHPLVRGLGAFATRDELYLSRLHPPLHVLLSAQAEASCRGVEEVEHLLPRQAPEPVLYLKQTGAGSVCYCTLGHCHGRFDTPDVDVDDSRGRELGSWAVPQFSLLMDRLITWAVSGGSQLPDGPPKTTPVRV